MIPLFLFFQLVASPLFFFFFFFFFHDLITDPFCNQLPRKMNRCFLIGRIPFSTPLCTRFERKIFPSEYTNGVKCARIDKRRVDVLWYRSPRGIFFWPGPTFVSLMADASREREREWVFPPTKKSRFQHENAWEKEFPLRRDCSHVARDLAPKPQNS